MTDLRKNRKHQSSIKMVLSMTKRRRYGLSTKTMSFNLILPDFLKEPLMKKQDGIMYRTVLLMQNVLVLSKQS